MPVLDSPSMVPASDLVGQPDLELSGALPSWRTSGALVVVVLGLALGWSGVAAGQGLTWTASVVLAAAVGLVLVVGVAAHLLERDLERPRQESRWVRHVASQLVPLVLLTTVYPLAQHRSSLAEVGGVPLRSLLLSVSLTVPWLGQLVCMPLYASITRDLPSPAGDRGALALALASRLRHVFAASCLVVAAATAAVCTALGFSAVATAAYAVSVALHVVFMQLLVLAVLGRRPGLWALAWSGYALAVLVAPDRWWLPPLVSAVVLLSALLRDLPDRPAGVRTPGIALEFGKGALMGAALWADKLLLFLRSPEAFPATTAFAALVPALITYNYYFGRVAPQTDVLVGALQQSMQHDEPQRYAATKARLTTFVDGSTKTVLLLGAVLTLAGTVLLPLATGGLLRAETGLDASGAAVTCAGMLVWGWTSLCVTLLSYKLAYLGRQQTAYLACAAQAALVVLVFALGLSTPATYTVLAVGGVAVVVPLLTACMRLWAHPDHSLFWRQAVRW